MALRLLQYGPESSILRRKDMPLFQSSEMKCLRKIKGCVQCDMLRNEDSARKSKPVHEYFLRKREWKQHVDRIDCRGYQRCQQPISQLQRWILLETRTGWSLILVQRRRRKRTIMNLPKFSRTNTQQSSNIWPNKQVKCKTY